MDPYLMQMLGMVMQSRQPETIKDDSGLIMSNTGSLQGVGQGTGFNFPSTGQGMPQAAIMPGDQPGIPMPNLPQLRAPQARSAGFTTGNILHALLGSNFGQR